MFFVVEFITNCFSHKFGVGVLAGEEFKLRAGLVDEHRDAVDCFCASLFALLEQ